MSADAKLSATDDALLGRKVGGYTITRRVGQGGMGVVYEAKHALMDKRAAVKVLHRELSADQKLLQRFLNEAKASSAAHHSSIVSIFEYGQLDDGTAFIMMEFLDGEPLLTRMEKAQNADSLLPFRLVVELTRQLAAALAVIHQKGIIHRDLKPENIFVVPDSVAPLGERVKLLDFGIAKVLDGKARKTTVGMILGTPLYMSPEQCEGSEDLDSKVDVYALGVLLYEMLCGHLPFIADTAAALMRQHMFKEPPPLEQQVLELPEELGALVHRMLAKAPAERPTMTQICEELEKLLPQLGVRVSGPHAQVPLGNSGRRRQISVGGGMGSTDPFASTAAGNELSVTPITGRGKAQTPEAFAATMAGSERDSLPPKPVAAEPVSVTAPTMVSRNRLPAVLGAALVLVLLVGFVTLRSRPTVSTNTITNVVTPAVQPVAVTPTAPPPKPAATAPLPAAGDADGDDEPDPRKGRKKSKRGKKQLSAEDGKKPAEDGETKKPQRPGKSSSEGDADVWR